MSEQTDTLRNWSPPLVLAAADRIDELEFALASERAARTAAEATIAQVKAELDRYDQSDEPEEYRECAPEDRWRLYRDLDTILAAAPSAALDAHDAQVKAEAWWEGVQSQWKHRPIGLRVLESKNPYRKAAQ